MQGGWRTRCGTPHHGHCERPAFARCASYGGLESAEAWSAKAEAKQSRARARFLDCFVAPIAANPKFAQHCRKSGCELRVQSGNRIIDLLVSFDSEVRIRVCRNVERTSESGH